MFPQGGIYQCQLVMCLVVCFPTGQWTQTHFRLCKHFSPMETDEMLLRVTWPSQWPNLNPVMMVWDELDCKVNGKQTKSYLTSGNSPKTVGKTFQLPTSWSWSQFVSYFMFTIWFHMCSFMDLTSSVIIYNAESNNIKKNRYRKKHKHSL